MRPVFQTLGRFFLLSLREAWKYGWPLVLMNLIFNAGVQVFTLSPTKPILPIENFILHDLALGVSLFVPLGLGIAIWKMVPRIFLKRFMQTFLFFSVGNGLYDYLVVTRVFRLKSLTLTQALIANIPFAAFLALTLCLAIAWCLRGENNQKTA